MYMSGNQEQGFDRARKEGKKKLIIFSNVVYLADVEQALMGDVEDDAVLPAHPPHEGVHVVHGELLHDARVPPRAHDGVPEDVHHAGVQSPSFQNNGIDEREMRTYSLRFKL